MKIQQILRNRIRYDSIFYKRLKSFFREKSISLDVISKIHSDATLSFTGLNKLFFQLHTEVFKEFEVKKLPDYSTIQNKISLFSKSNMTNARLLTIARTECNAAINSALYEKALEDNKLFKIWISEDDARDSHKALNGKRMLIEGFFISNLRYPCDHGGSLKEVVNCRCLNVYE